MYRSLGSVAEPLEIEDVFRSGKATWPDVDLPLERFSAHVQAAQLTPEALVAWGPEVYLTCAASCNDNAAIAHIDALYLEPLLGRICRMGWPSDGAKEVLQAARERLFVGRAARIRKYRGTGPLGQWLKVVVIRTAIDLRRAEPNVGRLGLAPSSPPSVDPTVLVAKQRYRGELESALAALLQALPERERSVLRLHLLEDVSIEQIARMHNVHRVTVARWIWSAGDELLEGLHDHFRTRFGMSSSACDSVVRAVQSQLALDLTRLL
jgi:RNA polymerase sigma-70 factor (ECF subfamily)